MAYNRSNNPDALPAFAEPERRQSNPQRPSQPQPSPTYNQYAQQQPPPVGGRPGRSGTGGYRPSPTPPVGGGYAHATGPHPGGYGHSPPPAGYDRPPPSGGYGQSPSGYGQPPPSGGYGQPPNGYGSSPPHMAAGNLAPSRQGFRGPPTPAPASAASNPALLPIFRQVDRDGSGQLSEVELRQALVNGDWSHFDPHTVRMMIRMFDSNRSGTIGFDEFCGLWGFLAAWRTLFDRFDVDRSGNINLREYTDALVAFGYRLSPQFVELMFRTYDKRREGAISFDLFVQSCITLKRMTDVFKKYDEDRDGFITLSFEDFLTEIIRQR